MLKDKYDRVILWGDTITGGSLQAELAYFDSNLNNSTIWVASSTGGIAYEIKLPTGALRRDAPSKSQNVIMDIKGTKKV